jgi:hypothetical protein
MKKYIITIFLLLFLLGSRCKLTLERVLKSDQRRYEYPIIFEEIEINPIRLSINYDAQLDSSFFTSSYLLCSDFNVVHHCSSSTALATGNFNDTITILNASFPLSSYFKDAVVKIRVQKVEKFMFEGLTYLVLVCEDQYEGGNRIIDQVVFIARITIDKQIQLFCPPLNINNGNSNTQPLGLLNINDFDEDKHLDFLQWNENDTIFMYSIYEQNLEKRREFIKMKRKSENQSISVMDGENSNWPFLIPVFLAKSGINFQPTVQKKHHSGYW